MLTQRPGRYVKLLLCAFAVFWPVSSAQLVMARPVERLPYGELLKRSDLVLIGVVESSKDDPARAIDDELKSVRNEVVAVDTTLEVRAVLKGAVSLERIRISHFRYKPSDVQINNGPRLVKFKKTGDQVGTNLFTGKPEYSASAPEYLVFLKKMPDGTFVPVTGQFDPDDSVRRLQACERDKPKRVED